MECKKWRTQNYVTQRSFDRSWFFVSRLVLRAGAIRRSIDLLCVWPQYQRELSSSQLYFLPATALGMSRHHHSLGARSAVCASLSLTVAHSSLWSPLADRSSRCLVLLLWLHWLLSLLLLSTSSSASSASAGPYRGELAVWPKLVQTLPPPTLDTPETHGYYDCRSSVALRRNR